MGKRSPLSRQAPEDTVVVSAGIYLRANTLWPVGVGIAARRATAASYAERKGRAIVDEYCDEGISAKSLTGRHGAEAALSAVRSGKAAGLLVAKMDRLSRSVVDGAGLTEAARLEGWALHFAGLDIYTGTPAGEMAAHIIISGCHERRLISQRTRVHWQLSEHEANDWMQRLANRWSHVSNRRRAC